MKKTAIIVTLTVLAIGGGLYWRRKKIKSNEQTHQSGQEGGEPWSI